MNGRNGGQEEPEWELEFFEDEDGKMPAKKWLDSLSAHKRAAMTQALAKVLAYEGHNVCDTEWGKNLKKGLYEFRLRHTAEEVAELFPGRIEVEGTHSEEDGDVLLRVFFGVYGKKVVLLLGGYDKGKSPKAKTQQSQIKAARKRLKAFRRIQRKENRKRRILKPKRLGSQSKA